MLDDNKNGGTIKKQRDAIQDVVEDDDKFEIRNENELQEPDEQQVSKEEEESNSSQTSAVTSSILDINCASCRVILNEKVSYHFLIWM